jgi:hypothetical protein
MTAVNCLAMRRAENKKFLSLDGTGETGESALRGLHGSSLEGKKSNFQHESSSEGHVGGTANPANVANFRPVFSNSGRIGVSGLAGTKDEETFCLWRHLADRGAAYKRRKRRVGASHSVCGRIAAQIARVTAAQ